MGQARTAKALAERGPSPIADIHGAGLRVSFGVLTGDIGKPEFSDRL
jgi:hypothetical protein